MFSVFLLSVAANLDTLLIAFSYSLRKQTVSIIKQLILCTLTCIGTFLSMKGGSLLTDLLPFDILPYLGGGIMILFGLYFLIQECRQKETSYPDTITMGHTLLLGLALSLNNVGTGIAAGMIQIPILPTVMMTFFLCLLFFQCGQIMSRALKANDTPKWLSLTSSFILVFLGIYEIFF